MGEIIMNDKKPNITQPKKQQTIAPKNIDEAMLLFQQDNITASKTTRNPFFKNTYASLEEVMKACDHGNKYGILYGYQSRVTETGNLNIIATATHVPSGTSKELPVPCLVPNLHDPQKLGSAITYAKRYALQALFALPSQDDDGNKANGITVPTGIVQPKQPQSSNKKTGDFA